MYQRGRGVPQDYSEAVHWYRQAAEQGYAPAHFNLALMYERGTGIEQDYGRAYFWYAVATTGSPGTTKLTREAAVQARDNVARHLSADERQRLEREIREWLPRGASFDELWDVAK